MLTETLVCRIITFYSVHFNIVMMFFFDKTPFDRRKKSQKTVYLFNSGCILPPPPLYSPYTLHMNDWDLVPFK